MNQDTYQAQDQQFIFNTYARYPITLVKGEGAYVWDTAGKKYLDFLSGIGCTSLGHCHPAVTAAINKQAAQILHTSNLYYSLPNIALAKFLVDQGGLDKVFFCNSGAEANETAIKIARKYQWKRGMPHKNVILSVTHSFHGRTIGALTATAKPKIHEGFAPLPDGFKYQSWDDSAAFCAAIDENTAAVLLEPIQGEGGIHVPPTGLLAAVRARCDEMGALLIFDEVQCGIGRTGSVFAYQHMKVKPDIITLAKGIANGMPLGAVCAQSEAASALSFGDHGTTFGGNPVSCSAALATLKTLTESSLLTNVKTLGAYLVEKLITLQKQYPKYITEIRGQGLMLGIELVHSAPQVLTHCRQGGLLMNVTAENVLRLLPPYVITMADIDFAVDTLNNALKTITH